MPHFAVDLLSPHLDRVPHKLWHTVGIKCFSDTLYKLLYTSFIMYIFFGEDQNK